MVQKVEWLNTDISWDALSGSDVSEFKNKLDKSDGFTSVRQNFLNVSN